MKKFAFLLIWILSIVSCEKQKDPPSGFGKLEGYVYLHNESNPIQGLNVRVSGNLLTSTDSKGYFYFSKVSEGVQTLEVLYLMSPIYSSGVNVLSDKLVSVVIPLNAIKKDLPDFTPVDLSNESAHVWDYWAVGKKEYFYINVENSKPKSVLYHAESGKDYAITFDSKGLPSRVVSPDGSIILFSNFKGNKVDIGIISPLNESIIIRDVQTDFVWPTSSKSIQSRADLFRWTGRILGAIPCAASVATAFATGGFATYLALWTCGNYFLKIVDSSFDDASIKNGFTDFYNAYDFAKTDYECVTTINPASCIINLASKGFEKYADYLQEMEEREAYIARIEGLIANNVSLKTLIIQPGPEGKDSFVRLWSFDDCIDVYEHAGNDSLISVMYDHWGICAKEVHRMLIQFPLGQVPLNATISSAKIEIYGWVIMHTNDIPTLSIMRIKSAWSESTTEWIKESDLELLGEIDFINKGVKSLYSLDVTYIVRDWISGDKINYGFQISSYENGVGGEIYSGDHPNVIRRPKLIISYY